MRLRVALTLVLLVGLSACGGGEDEKAAPPPKAPPKHGGGTPQPPPGAVAPLAPQAPPQKEALLAEVRKRQLTNEDFKETPTNRDPFRSFLRDFIETTGKIGPKHPIKLEKFGLDELKLAAIVSGDSVTPRAMFIDPSGTGVNVQRGEHVSKADALVVRVAPDRVYFELEEEIGGGKTRKVERVIELHQGELVNQ